MQTPNKRDFGQPGIRPLPRTPTRSVGSVKLTHQSLTPSTSSAESTTFWETPPKAWKRPMLSKKSRIMLIFELVCQFVPSRRAAILIAVAVVALVLFNPLSTTHSSNLMDLNGFGFYEPVRPTLPPSNKLKPDPIRWLLENSNNKHVVSDRRFPHLPSLGTGRRPRAAIISLVRNSELPGIIQSMQQLEFRWNIKYQYPWIFFNDEPFTDEFKARTQNLTTAECYYAIVPIEHWSLPEWIDESRFLNGLEYLGTIGVGKGWMVSYHHMCRWNSGFFYKHPILEDYDWYWRVEPDVHYFCDIDYDVFRFMRDNHLQYGFNMNILDDARSFPSLWPRTKAFAASHPHLIHPEADLAWLLDSQNGGEYNSCQFFSNFEIGSLNFWRGTANEAYFNWLDKAGGFYYERFGDAPVHTLSVTMFVPKREIWFFRDMGYQHDINHHCPPKREAKCACQPTSIDENFYKLVPLQSPQKKPLDTCIRQFLGGEWLEKRDGWTIAGEKAFGGDGYHGYVLWGDE